MWCFNLRNKIFVIFSDIISIILFLSVAYIVIIVINISKDQKLLNFIPLLAFYVSTTAIMVSTGFTTISDINKRHNEFKAEQLRKKEDERRNKEIENQYLKNSIDMFYIPLLDLLEKDNVNLINVVNGHKYLAQPRVRLLFETYLQTNQGKEKLLRFAHRDLEQLQEQLKQAY